MSAAPRSSTLRDRHETDLERSCGKLPKRLRPRIGGTHILHTSNFPEKPASCQKVLSLFFLLQTPTPPREESRGSRRWCRSQLLPPHSSGGWKGRSSRWGWL